jgi:hypothetical protein
MRTKPLLVRISAIIIPCAHVLIVISLFFPFAPFQESVSTGWQWFLRPSGLASLDLYSIVNFNMLIMALTLPPLASLAVFSSPTRMMGLLGVWISLPLTLFYYYVCVNTTIDYHGFLISVSPAVWFPPVGFALSFISCLALALSLPHLRTGAQERRAMRRPAHLEAGQHEGAERVSHPDGGELPAYVTRRSLRPYLAFIGLLRHLLIGLSLSFPYTELHDGYEGGLLGRTTGWQLLGTALQSQSIFSVVALLLLAAVVLPAFIYLACLLPFPRKSDHREALLVFFLPGKRTLESLGGFDTSLYQMVRNQTRTSFLRLIVRRVMQFHAVLFVGLPARSTHRVERTGERHKRILQGFRLALLSDAVVF